MTGEIRFGAFLLALGVAASIGIYLVTGDLDRDNRAPGFDSLQGANSFEGVPTTVFSPTGKYVSDDTSMPLIVHAYEVTPDYVSVVYTLVGEASDTPVSFSPVIVDDRGQRYTTIGNAILGSRDGVLAGLLVAEAHIPGGSLLSIEGDTVETADGGSRGGRWSIPFLQTTEPNDSITFIEGGRLSPEEGVELKGATVGVAGPPGSSPTEVLVHRGGKTTSLFGVVERHGATKAMSQQEFESMLGVSGYPKPPSFPTTAPASE